MRDTVVYTLLIIFGSIGIAVFSVVVSDMGVRHSDEKWQQFEQCYAQYESVPYCELKVRNTR